jgi:hypothetical protein
VRLERLRVREDAGRVRRTVELAWIGGSSEVTVEVPAEYAPAADDYSPFVPVALLAAMRRAEPLQIDGPVSERLLGNLTHAQEIVSAWNPTLRRVAVRATGIVQAAGAPAPGRVSCFSRGIDSTYSAAIGRPPGEELGGLVFWRDFELGYTEPTRRREVELVEEAAGRLGLPVAAVVSSDVPRHLVDVVDFTDATSAMLAAVTLSLPGLAGRCVIPSAIGYIDLGPIGTHPLLDGLWSTEAVSLEHDSCVPTREGKIDWLVRNRPDMLELLHVCMEQDSVENCGRCGKCLWTMVALHVSGGLERAAFPDRIDPRALRRAPRPAVHQLRLAERMAVALAGRKEDAALERAVRHVIRANTRKPMPSHALGMLAMNARRTHFLMHGHVSDVPPAPSGVASAEVAPLDPALPPPRDQPAGVAGLTRGVDHEARRHRYAAGGPPPGQRSGELGALLVEQPEDGVPLELDADGRPLMELQHAPTSARGIAKWVLDPLAWRKQARPRARMRSVARRTADLRRRSGASAGGRTVGWLHLTGGPGRVELFAAAHPVLDDVLLTTDPGEARELGYGEPMSVGFLEQGAPVTGTPGIAQVDVPWARHWGRRG